MKKQILLSKIEIMIGGIMVYKKLIFVFLLLTCVGPVYGMQQPDTFGKKWGSLALNAYIEATIARTMNEEITKLLRWAIDSGNLDLAGFTDRDVRVKEALRRIRPYDLNAKIIQCILYVVK